MTRKRVKEDRPFMSRLQFKMAPARQREIAGLALFTFGGLILLSLLRITPGAVSERAAVILRMLFGWGAFVLPLVIFGLSAILMRRGNATSGFPWGRVFAGEVFFAAVLAMAHLFVPLDSAGAVADAGDGGGFVGLALSAPLASVIGGLGAGFVFLAIAVFTLPALMGLNTLKLDAVAERFQSLQEPREKTAKRSSTRRRSAPVIDEPELEEERPPELPEIEIPFEPDSEPEPEAEPEPEFIPSRTRPVFERSSPAYAPLPGAPSVKHPTLITRKGKRIPLPKLDLLEAANEAKYSQTDAERKKKIIEETLANFGIPVKVIEVNAGPTITQFGLEPGFIARKTSDGQTRQRKVSVSRIAALQHDLELALAAAPIRIETPVPGRPIVGIEVPNESISLVSLYGILVSEAYKKKKGQLRMALGRDVSGTAVAADLGGMPHLLIAGATGSGKSVCINAIIACLLFDNSPDELRMIMVDPKRVELTSFNKIPHLLGEVIVNVEEVVGMLRWVVDEMDSRFAEFAKVRVRNIEAYNDKAVKDKARKMPYIVVVIDELADLMLAAPDETEKRLTRLAQLARATGIHLILATQRPSVDVVTGLIKANFPARISFAVTSSVDSRVVLDTSGAEKLLGRGDMLYMASDSSKLARLQGCFVSDDELARLVNYWREAVVKYDLDIADEAPWKALNDAAQNPTDELLEEAIELVRQSDQTSISSLQTKMRIGYPRAARLMDQLEACGVVGPAVGGSKMRTVLPPPEPPEPPVVDNGRSKRRK